LTSKLRRRASISCAPASGIDERSWIARGLARLGSDPAAALADFDQALTLDPTSRDALQNKAHVLAEKLPAKTPDEKQQLTLQAIEQLDKALALYPDFAPARSGRGVLLARLGKRDAAVADARGALQRDTRPEVLYQVACIYALTVKEQPDDRLEALRLLAAALRQGYGHELLEIDSDLDLIRNNPEFRKLVTAARTLRGGK
jgi:tetratricopeptide (TPR) repeat protein